MVASGEKVAASARAGAAAAGRVAPRYWARRATSRTGVQSVIPAVKTSVSASNRPPRTTLPSAHLPAGRGEHSIGGRLADGASRARSRVFGGEPRPEGAEDGD